MPTLQEEHERRTAQLAYIRAKVDEIKADAPGTRTEKYLAAIVILLDSILLQLENDA